MPVGELTVSDATVDFGATATTATITITNRGDGPLGWSAQPADANLFAVSVPSGELAANASTTVAITFDRTAAAEGDIVSSIAVNSDGGDATVGLLASLDVAPVIVIAGPTELWQNAGVCAEIADPARPTQATATVTITDDSRPLSIVAAIGGAPATVVPSANDPDAFMVDIGPSTRATVLTLSVSATDARGNQAERSITITVNECEADL